MAFRVDLSEPAKLDIVEAAEFIASDSIERARRWILLLDELITSLSEMPRRFPPVPELPVTSTEIREARHFSHRVVFRIDPTANVVLVIRVYHVARRPLKPQDF